MFRKLLITSVIFAVTASAFASSVMPSYKSDPRANYKGEMPPAPCPTSVYAVGPYVGVSVAPRQNLASYGSSYVSLEGTFFGGYSAMIYPNFYLAAEMFGQDSVDLKTFSIGNVSPRSTWGYGGSVIPGIMITEHVLGFLRAGAVRTHFNQVASSINLTGWQLGGGAQTNFWSNWDVRAEYVYSQYNKSALINKPMAHQFNVGLIYILD